jgi:hypothetical protein
MIDLRLGGLVEGDSRSIFESRFRWLTGREMSRNEAAQRPQPWAAHPFRG